MFHPNIRPCKIWVGFTLLLSLSTCSPNRFDAFDAHAFHPDLILCADHSTLDSLRENENDLKHMEMTMKGGVSSTREEADKFFNQMLSIEKKLADKGNPWGIASMGWLLSQKGIENYRFDHGASSGIEAFPTGIMPDSMRKEIVIALSYIYVGASIANTEHYDKDDPRGSANNDIFDLIAAIERQQSKPRSSKFSQYPVTPAAWIAEAKANVQQWKTYCSRK